MMDCNNDRRDYFSLVFRGASFGFALNELILNDDSEASDYRFIEVNAALAEMFGLSEENITGKTASVLIRDDKKPDAGLLERYDRVVRTQVNDTFEKQCHISGKWYRIQAMPTGGMQFATIFTNITENKHAEENLLRSKASLEKSEKRYQYLFDNAPVGILLENEDGIIIDANESFCVSTGYKKEEMIGSNITMLLPVELHYTVKDNIRTIINGNNLDIQVESFKKDGNMVVFRLLETKVTLPDGTPGILSISKDISEQIKAEKGLKESLDKYHRLAANMSDLVWTTDLHLNNTYTSPSVLKMLGFTQEEYGKRTMEDNYPASCLEHFVNTFRNELFKEYTTNVDLNRNWQIEAEHYHAKGHKIWVAMNISFIRDESGIPVGLQGVTRDVTERKKHEEDLQRAKEKAEESNRLKSHFLANLSHEIRTPMNGILGFLNLMQDVDLSSEEKEKYIALMNQSGKRLLDTINDIIEMSKIEAGQINIVNSSLDIPKMFRFLYDFFKPQTDQKGLTLLCNVQERTQWQIFTDRFKLEAILINLIKNAVKFTRHGAIEFGVKSDKNSLVFFVSDTGIGIPDDRLEAVFDRFVQADMNITRDHEGSGLGLPIARAYAEALGGNLRVESETGTGSTFFLTLPLNASTVSEPFTEEPAAEMNPVYPRLTILIVEDNETTRVLLHTMLRKMNLNILQAVNGPDAVEIAREHPEISLILMDIKLPVISGLEATRRIREFNGNVVIIGQSAYAREEDREAALEAGCNGYLVKPFRRDELNKMLKTWLPQL